MSLEKLDSVASTDPSSLTIADARVLCECLLADDSEKRRRAEDVRDEFIDTGSDRTHFVAVLCESLTANDYPPPRAVTETLYRVLREYDDNADEVARVAALLDADTTRERGVALAVLERQGLVADHADAFVAALAADDERVRALGVHGLASVPAVARDHLSSIRPFLAEAWTPADRSGLRLSYGKHPHGNPELGEPPGERLTNEAVSPYRDALAILCDLAATDPDAMVNFVPRLRELLNEQRDGEPRAVLGVLVALARADRSAVAPALPAARELADAGLTVARELLATVGEPLDHPDPVPVPETMSPRDRPKQPGDEELLGDIDIDLIGGELDPAEVVPLLECEDGEVRDEAWWGLSTAPVADPVLAVLDDHATTLLSLLDEPHDCARDHMSIVFSSLARQFPERWAPALAELATRDDAVVAETARAHFEGVHQSTPALVDAALDAAGVDPPEEVAD